MSSLATGWLSISLITWLLIGWQYSSQPTDWLAIQQLANWLVGNTAVNQLIGWQYSGQGNRSHVKNGSPIVAVWISPITHRHAYIFCLTTTSQVPIIISVQIYMCTKERNVYIKFVRVSNNLYNYARYLLRLWCSRMRHGGKVSRGRWDMRWWYNIDSGGGFIIWVQLTVCMHKDITGYLRCNGSWIYGVWMESKM